MKVLIPFTEVAQETGNAVAYYVFKGQLPKDVTFSDVSGDDQAYWRLLGEWWAKGEDFIVIEHDVVVHGEVASTFESCPSLWCTFGYPRHRAKALLTQSLGCVRFRAELIRAEPDLIKMAGAIDYGAGRAHWTRLDDVIAELLRQAHYRVCTHLPEVEHVALG